MASTGTGTGREQALMDAVEQFINAHNAWVEDVNSEHPTIAYWDAADELFEAFDSGSIPAASRRLAAAVYELAEEKRKHEASDNVDPSGEFWARREQLEDTWNALRFGHRAKYRETVKELDRQNVPHEQIARIWGLRHRDGSGNAALVARELEFPGSVIGPDYIHPDDVEADQRASAVIARHREAQPPAESAAATAPAGDVCPETSEELWLQKVPIPQAAKMLRRPADEVAREWKEFEQGRIERKQAREAAESAEVPSRTAAAAPPSPPVPETVEEADAGEAGEDDEPLANKDDQPDDDRYAEFSEWSDDDVRAHARRLGIAHRSGRWSRARVLDRILEAEDKAKAEADAGPQLVSPEEAKP